jgi:exopolysaccharide biosynthesis polyprenyl glycosylphosphotransferase
LFKKNVLIVGSGSPINTFIEQVQNHEIWGVNIIGIVNGESRDQLAATYNLKVHGTFKEFKDILLKNPVDEVVCSLPLNKLAKLQYVLEICDEIGISVIVISNFFNLVVGKSKMGNIAGMPVLAYSMTPDFALSLMLKRALDIILSSLAIVILLPAFLLIGFLIKITSPGPIFFSQERCTTNGRRFTMYKFRTMVNDAEARQVYIAGFNEVDGPVFKIHNDPRITKIGKILRRTSLDEIPQFFNVLKGEMSLVGPRPPIPKEVKNYQPWQRRRLSMKPGLTCIWQVSGRSNIGFDEWMKMDLQYIDEWSLALDIKLLLKTIPELFNGKGAY